MNNKVNTIFNFITDLVNKLINHDPLDYRRFTLHNHHSLNELKEISDCLEESTIKYGKVLYPVKHDLLKRYIAIQQIGFEKVSNRHKKVKNKLIDIKKRNIIKEVDFHKANSLLRDPDNLMDLSLERFGKLVESMENEFYLLNLKLISGTIIKERACQG